MSTEQREQSKLAIATFIVATGIAVTQADNNLDTTKPPDVLTVLNAVVLLAIMLSVMLALMYILGKASELRDKPPKLQIQKLLVRHREKFYSLSVTLYLPFIGALGGMILLMEWVTIIDGNRALKWATFAAAIMISAVATWFWPTNKRSKG